MQLEIHFSIYDEDSVPYLYVFLGIVAHITAGPLLN